VTFALSDLSAGSCRPQCPPPTGRGCGRRASLFLKLFQGESSHMGPRSISIARFFRSEGVYCSTCRPLKKELDVVPNLSLAAAAATEKVNDLI
jgi:hypothetical protein